MRLLNIQQDSHNLSVRFSEVSGFTHQVVPLPNSGKAFAKSKMFHRQDARIFSVNLEAVPLWKPLRSWLVVISLQRFKKMWCYWPSKCDCWQSCQLRGRRLHCHLSFVRAHILGIKYMELGLEQTTHLGLHTSYLRSETTYLSHVCLIPMAIRIYVSVTFGMCKAVVLLRSGRKF